MASPTVRMGPSIPAQPPRLGCIDAISEVTGRAAKPRFLVLTHRAPALGDPGTSIRPSMTPFREATRIAVGKTSPTDSPRSRLAAPA